MLAEFQVTVSTDQWLNYRGFQQLSLPQIPVVFCQLHATVAKQLSNPSKSNFVQFQYRVGQRSIVSIEPHTKLLVVLVAEMILASLALLGILLLHRQVLWFVDLERTQQFTWHPVMHRRKLASLLLQLFSFESHLIHVTQLRFPIPESYLVFWRYFVVPRLPTFFPNSVEQQSHPHCERGNNPNGSNQEDTCDRTIL